MRGRLYVRSNAEARRVHLEKLTKVKDAVIKVVPRTDATTKPLTGRWVDTMHDDGARKGQVDDAWYEQTLNGKRGLLLSNASDDAPQDDVGRGSSERTSLRQSEIAAGPSTSHL